MITDSKLISYEQNYNKATSKKAKAKWLLIIAQKRVALCLPLNEQEQEAYNKFAKTF